MRRWACDWPLSSVGIRGIEVANLTAFYESPGLMRLYVDRITAAGDQSRLDDDVVRDHILTAVGMYPELAPNLALNDTLNDNGEMS